MKIIPNENIIPSKIDSVQVEKNLEGFSQLLEEIRNFGSFVIENVFNNNEIDDYVRLVTSCLLRQIIELLDATAILIKKSSSEPCNLLIRGLFESYLFIKFLLEKNSKERAKVYYVCYFMKKREWEEKRDPASIAGEKLQEKLINDGYSDEHFSNQNSKTEIEKIDQILKNPLFDKIISKYKLFKKKPHWYTLFTGYQNLYELAEKLKCSTHYDILYKYFSEYAHSEKTLENIDARNKGEVGIEKIRNPENAQSNFQTASTFAMESYHTVILNLIPKMEETFLQWYKENISPSISQILNKQLIEVIRS